LGEFLNKVISYFIAKKHIFFFALVLFVGASLVGLQQLKIEESIFSTLPKGASFERFNELIEDGGLSRQIVFSVELQSNDEDNLDSLSQVLSDSLLIYAGDYLEEVIVKRDEAKELVYNQFYNNFYQYVDDDYYNFITHKINEDTLQQSIESSYRNLLSPNGFVIKEFILNDPIFITSKFFKNLSEEANADKLNVENGYLLTADKKGLLITAKTNYRFSDNKKNVELNNNLKELKSVWNRQQQRNKVDFFGTFQIGAENEEQVKKDTFFTLIITLIVILLILFIFYRKILIPLYFMLPVIFGGLFALGTIGFIKPNVSGISIASGAVVFGIIMDFAFHFFTHLKHTRSIDETIKEISSPLILGALTTILAFGALLFTNSIVLQDFGLFASLTITGAVIFTITGLPIVLKLLNFNNSLLKGNGGGLNISIPQKHRNVFVGIIILLTGVFFYFSFDIQFDENLENLSLHSEELKLKEEKYTGINPETEKKIYFFAEGESFEKAALLNHKLYQEIKTLQDKNEIKSAISLAQYVVPDSIASLRLEKWQSFWRTHQEATFSTIDHVADSIGFNKNAFSSFKNWITQSEVNHQDVEPLLRELGLEDFVIKEESKVSFITSLVVDKAMLSKVQATLLNVEGISSFNKTEMATDLLAVVKSDFNYILIASSLLVFLSLLLIYGRIELALITFLPMAISWVWILGLAALFNIQFNFVNIVIATFIFGSGDDYSIFVTDGLLNKYKYKKNSLVSYNMAIVLSAITTMIGTGVLYFAEHPAIKSVALISVLGILCILIVSLTIQPLLFKLLIQNRVDKKKTPVTFVAFLISVFEFSWFVFGCFVAYFLLLGLIFLPLPKRRKKYFLNVFLSFATKSVIYFAPHVKKRIFSKNNLDLDNPSIIIANHTSFLDILLLLMLNPKIIIMVKGWVYNSILFGPLVRYAGYIYVGDDPIKDLETIKERIVEGYSLAIFPEGARSETDEIKRMHKGAFYLAKELNLDITPILIHGASYTLPKTEYFVKHGYLNLKVLPRIKANDDTWGVTFGKRTKSISAYFKQEYLVFKQENGKNLYSRVFANYVFKGPVLEWYLRIKWKLESKNFEYYNELLKEKSNLLDLGCGYGYLSYFLHYKNPNMKITGFDYDEEKIKIASNGFDKNEQLIFKCVDINVESFMKYDGILLNDVLHYFSKEKQINLLDKCANALCKNGVILIRDGITDLEDKHGKTELSEKLSNALSFV